MRIGELIGLVLIGYGIWFAVRGVKVYLGTDKNWWRPLDRRQRYPYPIAGILMGVFFVSMGITFVSYNVWSHAPVLGYVGGGVFLLVIVVGVAQPRFCHPHWYGELEDRLGRERVEQLKLIARRMENAEWTEVTACEASFNAWVAQRSPLLSRRQGRGYKRRDGG